MAYQVTVSPAADRIIARLPKEIRLRNADRLEALAQNPRPPGGVKLKGQNA